VTLTTLWQYDRGTGGKKIHTKVTGKKKEQQKYDLHYQYAFAKTTLYYRHLGTLTKKKLLRLTRGKLKPVMRQKEVKREATTLLRAQ